ncbi:hypothetical protein PR048_020797 [Dryococelus australis]|uniref:DUF4781 domain-containing protein n=1 Tax=Dryococelus australis TaxID=614101 RepID=A0ABQ9GWF3_9NEOP|nr:hypothetical protein PR048_020797 [Dryococelus australis]
MSNETLDKLIAKSSQQGNCNEQNFNSAFLKKAKSATRERLKNSFGDRSWDVYQQSEHHLLEKNVGYALYGPPEAMPDKENSETGYCKKKLEQIKKMCNLIVQWDQHTKLKNETWVAVLFVCLDENGECLPVPVFRVPKYNPEGESSIFIDHMGRVYEGWNKFLTKNCLNRCKYCYPVDGIYCGDENYNVQLEFGDTPACKTSRKFLDVLDTTNTCVAIGGTVIGLASLTALPIAAPVVAAGAFSGIASYLYGTTRSVGTLIDRKSHHQSISLDNGEACCCYMSVAAGALGMASGIGSRWVARVAQNGGLVSKTGKVVVTALNISSLATNGVGIVNNFFLLRKKLECGELSCLDVFQFTSSVLFFASAVVNVKTANAIIEETQESTLKNFEENLAFKKHKKLYRRMAKNTIADADDPMYGKAKVIKAVQHIDDPKEFFSNINKVRRELHETNTDISFGKSGTLSLNKEAQVEPTKFSAMSRDQRREFLTATKDLNDGTISHAEFQSLAQQNNVPVELVCNNSATSTEADSDKKSSMKLGEVIKLADEHMTGLLTCAISLERADYQLLLSYAERLCRELGFYRTADVLDTLNFIIDFINCVANSMEEQYQQDLCKARERYGAWYRSDKGRLLQQVKVKVHGIALIKDDSCSKSRLRCMVSL